MDFRVRDPVQGLLQALASNFPSKMRDLDAYVSSYGHFRRLPLPPPKKSHRKTFFDYFFAFFLYIEKKGWPLLGKAWERVWEGFGKS